MIRPQNAEEATPEQIAALELPVSQLQQQQAVERATDRLEAKQDDADRGGRRAHRGRRGPRRPAGRTWATGSRRPPRSSRTRPWRRPPTSGPTCGRRWDDARDDAWRTLAGRETRPERPNPDRRPPRPTAPAGVPADRRKSRTPANSQALAAGSRCLWSLSPAQRRGRAGRGPGRPAGRPDSTPPRSRPTRALTSGRSRMGFTNEQETLDATSREALGDEQKALGDEQTGLAEEQKDIADVRAKPIQVRDIAEVQQELAPSAVTQIDGIRAVTITATPDSDNLGALTQTVQQRAGRARAAGRRRRRARRGQRRSGRGVPRAGPGHAAGHRAGVLDHGRAPSAA